MLRLRTRASVDLPATPRTDPVRWGKWVYFAFLLSLAAWAADYAVGDAVFLRTDGLVISDHEVVASTYAGRVAAVNVKAGERVTSGQVLVELESPDMLRDIAQLAAQNAELAAREIPLRTRAAMLAALLPSAERGAQESSEVVRRLEPKSERGTVAVQRFDQALGSGLEMAWLAGLRGEAAVLNRELSVLDGLRGRADAALSQLESFYAGGRVRAVRDGVVGAEVPAPGRVVRSGDELMVIRTGEAYVIAWLPNIRLFEVAVGSRVQLTDGWTHAEGTVETLLSAPDVLPSYVQGMVRSHDPGLLVRIGLPDGHPFSMSQKLHVRGCVFGWCWR